MIKSLKLMKSTLRLDLEKYNSLSRRLGLFVEDEDAVERNSESFLTDQFDVNDDDEEEEGDVVCNYEESNNNDTSIFHDVSKELESCEEEDDDDQYQVREVPRVKLSSEVTEIEDSVQVARTPRRKKPRDKFNTLHYMPIDVLNIRNNPGNRREGFDIYHQLVCQVCRLPLRSRREKVIHMDVEHGIPCDYDEDDDIDGGDDDYSEMEVIESSDSQEDIIEIND